jgi:hypothetical protein
MDDGFKKTMIYVLVGSMGIMTTTLPSNACDKTQLCAIENAHNPHIHEREPGPAKTFVQITMETTASSFGTYFSVMK